MVATGSSLFQFRHGDHLCVFHRSEDSLMDVLTPYIAEGLRRGERIFCVQKPEVAKRIQYDLRFVGVDVDRAIRNGAIEFHTLNDVYLPDGKFESARMIDTLIQSIEDTVRKGFSGFRSAGDLSWAVDGRNECRQVIGYEAEVERCFPGRPAIGMCQYAIDSFPPDVLQNVMNLHRQRIADPVVPCSHTGLHVRNGRCVTEIVADRFVVNPKYYYVVERSEGGDVLGWGIASDFDSASEEAQALVSGLGPSYKYPN